MDYSAENCKKCHILNAKTGFLLCEADVEVSPQGEVLLIFSDWKPSMQNVYKQPVIFYDAVNGLVSCTCNLCEIKPYARKSGYFYAQCDIQSVKDLMDRHADFRLALSLTVTLTFTDPVSKQPKQVGGVTRNISAGGIYIIAAERLPANTSFRIHFHHNNLPITPSAHILREELMDNGRYGYGCAFEKMNPYTESLLRGFIFHMETLYRKSV